MTFTIPMSEVVGWRQSIKSIGVTILIAVTCVVGFAHGYRLRADGPDRLHK